MNRVGQRRRKTTSTSCQTHPNNTDDNVLQARSFRIVVQYERAIRLLCASERGRSHSRVQCGQMVVQRIEILLLV